MCGEYTIKRSGGRSLMIIDTGNAIWVGLWGLVLEMGWRNQAEMFAVADMCDHVGYFAWRDCWRDCDSGRQYPFVTGDDIFRLQANAPDQEKARRRTRSRAQRRMPGSCVSALCRCRSYGTLPRYASTATANTETRKTGGRRICGAMWTRCCATRWRLSRTRTAWTARAASSTISTWPATWRLSAR